MDKVGNEEITHASVRFLEDNVIQTVPVTYICKFKPKGKEDFNRTKAYKVWLQDEEGGDSDEGDFYKANILILGSKYF